MWEQSAGETWQRMRAEADRWRRFPRVQRERRSQRAPGTGVTVTPVREGRELPDIIA
jgi:hypothetical protein